MGQVFAFEQEGFHLALHPWMRMMESFIAETFHITRRKVQVSHSGAPLRQSLMSETAGALPLPEKVQFMIMCRIVSQAAGTGATTSTLPPAAGSRKGASRSCSCSRVRFWR